jgi:hypothetical protein
VSSTIDQNHALPIIQQIIPIMGRMPQVNPEDNAEPRCRIDPGHPANSVLDFLGRDVRTT